MMLGSLIELPHRLALIVIMEAKPESLKTRLYQNMERCV